MKEQILEYLNGERDFDLGLVLLNKFGNRKALSNLLESCVSKGESEYNRNKLDFELIKLVGVPYKVVAEQKMRNYELDIDDKQVSPNANENAQETENSEDLDFAPLPKKK